MIPVFLNLGHGTNPVQTNLDLLLPFAQATTNLGVAT